MEYRNREGVAVRQSESLSVIAKPTLVTSFPAFRIAGEPEMPKRLHDLPSFRRGKKSIGKYAVADEPCWNIFG